MSSPSNMLDHKLEKTRHCHLHNNLHIDSSACDELGPKRMSICHLIETNTKYIWPIQWPEQHTAAWRSMKQPTGASDWAQAINIDCVQKNGKHCFNPLNPELNPICYILALLRAHHFLHVSRIRVKSLTFRLLMSYIYGAHIPDVSRSHATTQHSR